MNKSKSRRYRTKKYQRYRRDYESKIECGIMLSIVLLGVLFIVGMHKVNKRVQDFQEFMEKEGYTPNTYSYDYDYDDNDTDYDREQQLIKIYATRNGK